jgi:hypothetical protein
MHHGGHRPGTDVTQTCPRASVRKYSLRIACNLRVGNALSELSDNCVNSVQLVAGDVASSTEHRLAECNILTNSCA